MMPMNHAAMSMPVAGHTGWLTAGLVLGTIGLLWLMWRRPRRRGFLAIAVVIVIPTHMLLMPRQTTVAGVHETTMAMPMTHPCCSPTLSRGTVVVSRPLAMTIVQIIRPTAPGNLPRPDLLMLANKSPPIT